MSTLRTFDETNVNPHPSHRSLAKVPAITAVFWVVKILATTLGETAGDTLSMTMGFGYLAGTAVFLGTLLPLVWLQIRSRAFHPTLYWAAILASTMAGTTLSDFATRSLAIGYAGGSALLLGLVLSTLLFWQRVQGSISVNSVSSVRSEIFYWATITFSQTLGTALGDWTADTNGLGYLGGATLFAAALLLLLILYRFTRAGRVFLFWSAFILTRPLGATVGDFLDKPLNQGGLSLSRPLASTALLGIIVILMLVVPQRPAGAGA